MPVTSKKDCSVILYDLAASSAAKQTFLKICSTTCCNNPKDLTKLVLLNSNVTENCMNSRHGGYNNIYEVAKDVTSYNVKLLHGMIEENNELGEANWLEGLLVAITNLENEFDSIGGIITRQVLFITDLKTPLQNYNEDTVNKIVCTLKKLKAFLYIVGPDVEPPFTIKGTKDLKNWMQNLKVDQKDQNLLIVNQIIQQTENSVVCSYKLGVHLFHSFRNWHGSQPWKVPLSVGSKIQIPAQTMKVLDAAQKCKMSRQSATYPVWVDAEDETIEFDNSDVISGIMRHEKFVQMPDSKSFQVQNPRGFNVLCFTDSENVSEYLMRGEGCYQVFSNGTTTTNESFNILVDRLAEQNKYAITRRIYNNNFNPYIAVLVPKPNHSPKCFLLTYLPFSDNMCINYKEKKLEAAPKIETSPEVYDFLDSMNIEGGKLTKRFPLGINMMQNYNTQRIINTVTDKILDQHAMLADLDLNLLEPPNGEAFETLKNGWKERTLKKIKDEEGAGDEASEEEFDW